MVNHLQIISNLTALCPSCHQVKHIGLAQLQGYGEQAMPSAQLSQIAHLTKLNGWTAEQTDNYLESIWDTWRQRSCHSWSLDLCWLNRYGIHIDFKNSN